MEDDVKMGPEVIGWECLNWIHLAQGRKQWQAVMNTVVNLQAP